MPRTRCLFRGTDLTRACLAAEKAGKKVTQIRVDKTGTMILVLDNGGAPDTAPNPWDADLRQEREATYRTIRKLGTLLSEAKSPRSGGRT